MSADNLPRPATPGPWVMPPDEHPLIQHAERIGPGAWTPAVEGAASLPVALCPGPRHHRTPDALAIAALPERIRRMDAVRAYADRVRPSLDHLHPSEVLDDVIYLLDGGDIDALHWGQEAGDE